MRILRVATACALLSMTCGPRAVDISERPNVRPLVGRCYTTRVRLVLLKRRDPASPRRRLASLVLAPPESALAPGSLSDYVSGRAPSSESVSPVMVVPAGVRITVTRVWSVKSVEAITLCVIGTALVGKQVLACDVSALVDERWRIYLADGRLSPAEADRLVGRPLLPKATAEECHASN